MYRSALSAVALLAFAVPTAACAQTAVYTAEPATASSDAPAKEAPVSPPKLIVTISVDQLSADLFAEYRGQFTGGLKRLQEGAVFPSGYQAQSATETCPGHSTILTGNYPARSGIIANHWIDLDVKRDDKGIYCAEDESVAGSTSRKYTVSDLHLLVPTLGERMKAANPASRVVSVAGKDRAAVMLGGHKVDELWWWGGKGFASYAGRKEPATVTQANTSVAAEIAAAQQPMPLSPFCATHSRSIPIDDGETVGDGRFARKAGDARGWRATPAFDNAVIALGAGLVDEMQLGRGAATDIIAIGASGTDYVGHVYGTSGSEMCIQLMALDQQIGRLLERLDKTGVDYAVMLTADHGGHDLPERLRQQAAPKAQRVTANISSKVIGAAIAKKLGLESDPLHSGGIGDMWIDRSLDKETKAKVLAEAVAAYRAHPLVAAVFTHDELSKTSIATTPPETWSPIERVRANFHPKRSGDLYIALKPRVTPIPDTRRGYVATHGSIWDYDRRVPILFWRKGMKRFEQPLSVSTVDIAPTLAAILKLPVEDGAFDGRCLDLDAGEGSTCE